MGGDLYDFIPYADGNFGVVMADVTDKGIPAALVMASARSILRGVADRLRSPGQVLARVNNLLCQDIPNNMFVTCLYAELNPEEGFVRFANAGQNLPYRKCGQGVQPLDATGMPLGLLTGMHYEEREMWIEPGEAILLYSDGLVEAHNTKRKMFGNERLEQILIEKSNEASAASLVADLWQELHRFTGPDWKQEDDVTLVVIKRLPIVEIERDTVDEPALADAD